MGITDSAMKGSSLGLALHFGMDATLQPAAYHDLPFSASMSVHQTIMGANALGEGLGIASKPSPVEVPIDKRPPSSAVKVGGLAVAASVVAGVGDVLGSMVQAVVDEVL